MIPRTFAALLGILVLLALLWGKDHTRTDQTRTDHSVTVSRNSPGRVFEGIGALSAGASSRLLIDYPEPARSAVLDYLFKPDFGASLQQLKVEIGGDVNSTDGTEPAHARTREEFRESGPERFNRGYEWWLMKEAKRRNPKIKLDVLQWGAPPWIGEEEVKRIDPKRRLRGARDFTTDPEGKTVVRKELGDREFRFLSRDNAEFIADFIQGAKKHHGLEIDFCGVWNEVTYEPDWIKLLRRTLDAKGLSSVKIVAADIASKHRWEIARDLLEDAELAKAVHAIGAHYPDFQSTPESLRTGKPLYASEDLSTRGDWESAVKYARAFNRNYIEGRMTKTIFWSLIASYYDYLDFAGCGPMRAVTPWSGNYEVQPAIWAIAHTTQFAKPGWRYLDKACGLTPAGGSYVSLLSPDGNDFSMILETGNSKKAERIDVALEPQLAGKSLSLWRSTKSKQFERLPDLRVGKGAVVLDLEPGAIYSLTTTTGQCKGEAPVPSPSPFPLPYAENFDQGIPGTQARYFSDQDGSFEITRRPDGSGNYLKQVVTRKGIPWLRRFLHPYTLIGPGGLKDFEISCDVMVPEQGSVGLGGCIVKSKADLAPGYWFEIGTDNRWKLMVYEEVLKNPKVKVLAEGSATFAKGHWHRIALRFQGGMISAFIDGREAASLKDTLYREGACGLMSGWNTACYENFWIMPLDR
jgi:galactosylceramidase